MARVETLRRVRRALKKPRAVPLSRLNPEVVAPMTSSTSKGRRSRRSKMSQVEDTVVRLKLNVHLGIEQASALQAELIETLDAPSVELDAAGVERIHAAPMQLLMAFFRDRESAGHQTRFEKPSERLVSAARQVGAASLFHL